MEANLKCNSLKCRTALDSRAVVTTCSHIFCVTCSERSGLANADVGSRVCPACDTPLSQTDDVVVAQLNPSEDYKTSVLSGLSPSIVVDCAGRALAFYAYQTTQEILYQEFLSKSVSDRHKTLNTQMDHVIHEANTEISTLRDRLSAMDLEQKDMLRKNAELVEIARQKTTAHRKLEKLYRALKQQQVAAGIELAAEHEVENTLRPDFATTSTNQSIPGPIHLGRMPPPQNSNIGHARSGAPLWMDAGSSHRLGQSLSRPVAPSPSQRSRLPLGSVRATPSGYRTCGLGFHRSPVQSVLEDSNRHRDSNGTFAVQPGAHGSMGGARPGISTVGSHGMHDRPVNAYPTRF